MKADFAIITIREDEFEAICAHFALNLYKAPSGRIYGISQIQTKDGKNCTVAIARASQQGNDAAQRTVNDMIHDLDPQMLLVVGIAGGVPDNDFTLGDVIVSTHIYNFDVNVVKEYQTTFDVTGGTHPKISDIIAALPLYESRLADWNSEPSIIMPRPSLSLTEQRLKDLIAENVDEAWRDKVERALRWHFDTDQRGARAPKYLPGTIASSNTLVRSGAGLAQWLQNARSIRAVEMEAAGVYQAAQQMSKQYPVMAIRGISDIVGVKRDENWTLYACHTAAAFAYAFIRAGIVEPRENETSPPPTASTTSANLSSIQPSYPSREHANMPIQNANTIKVFTIYADADKLHKGRLETQLSPFTWNGIMDLWDRDRIISSAGLTQQEIDKHIDSSQVILLLVSPHFFASEQCLTELGRAKQSSTTSKAIIIPINIRPTDWAEAPFEGLIALPRSGKPVSSWSNADEAWYSVAVDIRKACERLRKTPEQSLK